MSKLKTTPVIDADINLAYLFDMSDGSKEFMVEMINIFLDQTPGYLDQIDAAIINQDWKTVAEIAHKVRPTFAFIGMDTATQVMATIEQKARSGVQLDEILSDFEQIKPVMLTVFEKLNTIKAELDQ